MRGRERDLGSIFLVLLFLSLPGGAVPASTREFNVLDFGAVADGKTDSSKAFTDAWTATCRHQGTVSKMMVPSGNFFLNPISLSGQCNSAVEVQVEGTVEAPRDLSAFSGDKSEWIGFKYIDQLLLGGGGTLDGSGAAAWDCVRNNNCIHQRPTLLSFKFVNNSTVEKIKLVNAKMFHIHVFSCKNLTLQLLEISSPRDSPNTDGIHIGESQKVNVLNSLIRTGDDCVSVGGGNVDITISGINCGPGHGISIGSLGGAAGDNDVTGVSVSNCNLTGTSNGVRIKTWEKPYNLSVSRVVFEGIQMDRVSNPILIDQHYCPQHNCVQKSASLVKISNVKFQNIKGISSSKVAVQLSCSKAEPCEDIQLIDIDLTYINKDGKAVSSCSNVHGTTSGSIVPSSCF